MGVLSIGDINMLGRFMTFAILALGLITWGYVGILSLCNFLFCLGAYAMGIHLAHHGGPEVLLMPTVGRYLPVYLWFTLTI